MTPGLAKIIEQVRISRYFESAETDLHIAENLAVLITLTPGRRSEFSDSYKAKVRIAVLLIMDVKASVIPALELLERTF